MMEKNNERNTLSIYDPITVVVKGHGQISGLIRGIYRRSDLPMPFVRQDVTVVIEETGEEFMGVVQKVDFSTGRYDVRLYTLPLSAKEIKNVEFQEHENQTGIAVNNADRFLQKLSAIG
jgi:hypothetical protein